MKQWLASINETERRQVLWLAAALLVGLALLFGGRLAPAPPPQSAAATAATSLAGRGGGEVVSPQTDALLLQEQEIGRALERILSQVAGVGQVTVQVTLGASEQRRYATDNNRSTSTTTEKDTQGGTRTVTQSTQSNNLILSQSGGGNQPVLEQVLHPAVKGVLVVATGASDPQVRANLAHAVEIALGVPAYRILVLPGVSGK